MEKNIEEESFFDSHFDFDLPDHFTEEQKKKFKEDMKEKMCNEFNKDLYKRL